jgi:hypothetical protein
MSTASDVTPDCKLLHSGSPNWRHISTSSPLILKQNYDRALSLRTSTPNNGTGAIYVEPVVLWRRVIFLSNNRWTLWRQAQ